MEWQTNIKKIGDSNFILIPKFVMKQLKIKNKGTIKVSVSKGDIEDIEEFYAICSKCGNVIYVNGNETKISCTSCGTKNLNVNKLEKYYGDIY